MTPVEGHLPVDVLADCLDTSIFFEVDVYWTHLAGHRPAFVDANEVAGGTWRPFHGTGP